MTFLLDTDICVYWLRGNPTIRTRMAAVGPEPIGVSTITLAELPATARTYGFTLVTNNTDHLGRIEGLKLDNWLQP